MLFRKISNKTAGFLISAVFFLTPLLFFTPCHDQFELPKLIFPVFAAVFFAVFYALSGRKFFFSASPLSFSLLFLLGAQLFSSLPANSLSWSTSFLGDYENFSGLATLLTYLLWFFLLAQILNPERIEKFLLFAALAALLSSFHALIQHYGLDFIRWNPESVIYSREFASLGNPNFLAAYLAMAFPAALALAGRRFSEQSRISPSARIEPSSSKSAPGINALLFLAGAALLLLSAHGSNAVMPEIPFPALKFAARSFGFLFISIFIVRLDFPSSWFLTALLAAALAFGLASTGSRGGLLAAMAGFLCFSALVLSSPDLRAGFFQWVSKIPRGLSIVFLAAFSTGLVFFSHPFITRLSSSLAHVHDSLSTSRLHIWKPALKIIGANPWHGVGLDTFKIAFPYYSGVEFNQIDGMFVSSRTAHNELLQITATTGFLGLTAYLAVLAAFGAAWFRAYRNSQGGEKWLLAGILSSAASYHVQNLFSFGVSSLNLLWFFYLAAVESLSAKKIPSASGAVPSPKSVPTLSLAFFLAFVLCFLAFQVRRLAADVAFGRATAILEFLKKPDPSLSSRDLTTLADIGTREMKRSVELCPLEVKYHLYLGLAYEQLAGEDPPHAQTWLKESLSSYGQAVRMSPANAYYHNDIGRVCDLLSRFDRAYLTQAERSFHKAFELAPAISLFAVNWASALEKSGEESRARDVYKKAFALDNSFASRLLPQMALVEYQSGNTGAAFAYLAEAIRNNTLNAAAYYSRGMLYLEEKKRKPALEDFRAAKKLDPTIGQVDDLINQSK